MRAPEPREIGRVGDIGPTDVLDALGAAGQGRVYDLDAGRFVGMPQWDGHPTFTLTPYRTPQGIKRAQDIPLFGEQQNAAGVSMLTELMITGMHTGTHLDALCHITDADDTWFGGFHAAEHSSDFGPTRADAASIPPIVLRGVLLDAAGYFDVPLLEQGRGLSRADLEAVAAAQGTTIPPRSCVLVRTGLMSVWPDPARYGAADGAGPDLEAARWLIDDLGCVVLGSDTSTVEQVPSADPQNPHPVHEFALRQRGVHLLENAFLEDLARDGVDEFTLICLPLKIAGATGSMVRPIAIA
ncbi:cyclase family protein [Curtobacterium sp. MCBD17_040]|uniref:cyclase family protein n=1 Tax=Curtobacterium sp. MCBD17_040 TaxID=2175674 RepID=UPI000DA94056|nr:cyclase family protein [Curtobacterium sp. MCBD17_040]WIB64638.1 cyclase family protein [Curtobacterium sp. MCBD17_040]